MLEVWVDDRRFEFDDDHVVIVGRADNCDVCIDDHRISRRHVELRVAAGYWRIVDLDSANGTFAGGSPVIESVVRTTLDLMMANPDDGVWIRLSPMETMQTMPASQLLGSAHAVRIGRARDNDVVLNDDRASRYHAEFVVRENGGEIHDCNSANGTKVDGVLVDRAPVTAGSLIEIGDTTLRVTLASCRLVLTVVAEGSTQPLDVEVRRGLKPALASDEPVPSPALTGRERELVALVAGGASDKQIAGALIISVATVHSHLDRIQIKTGRRRRADLTRLAFELGLTPTVLAGP